VQRVLMERVPEVLGVVARTGSDELGMDPMGLNQTDTFLVLKPREEWRFETKDELLDAMRVELDDFAGVAYGFTQPIEMRVSEMLTGVRGDVAIKFFGDDLGGESTADSVTIEGAAAMRALQHPGAGRVLGPHPGGFRPHTATDRRTPFRSRGDP
jgi:cobalt-zinc-cadmium resistance protein CzcA